MAGRGWGSGRGREGVARTRAQRPGAEERTGARGLGRGRGRRTGVQGQAGAVRTRAEAGVRVRGQRRWVLQQEAEEGRTQAEAVVPVGVGAHTRAGARGLGRRTAAAGVEAVRRRWVPAPGQGPGRHTAAPVVVPRGPGRAC